jgi:hypothetical protein
VWFGVGEREEEGVVKDCEVLEWSAGVFGGERKWGSCIDLTVCFLLRLLVGAWRRKWWLLLLWLLLLWLLLLG